MARTTLPESQDLDFRKRTAASFKRVRKANGLTQQEWADLAGVARSVISDVESERIPCTGLALITLWKLADVVGLSMDELVDRQSAITYAKETIDNAS